MQYFLSIIQWSNIFVSVFFTLLYPILHSHSLSFGSKLYTLIHFHSILGGFISANYYERIRAITYETIYQFVYIRLRIYISRSYRLDKIIICCNSKTFQDFRLSRLWSSLPLNVALVKEENEFKRLPKVRIKLQPLGKKYFIKISCFISSIIKPFRTFRN